MKKILLLLVTSLVLFACEKEAPEQVADENGSTPDIFEPTIVPMGALPGKFTVNAEGKQVYFSKGNLFWNGEEFVFEEQQYTVFVKSDNEIENHVAHFYWSKSADVARSLSNYSDVGTSGDVFFANNPKSFKANEHTGWSVLTGGTNGEWKYLINRNGGTLYKLGVTVCDSENCLILLPDDWKWGENGVGTSWLSEYSESTIVKWSTMEAAGAVCLPAAGYRGGYYGDTRIYSVGNFGYYWSSTPDGNSIACDLGFNSGLVDPARSSSRYFASAVRLVTEYQSEPSAE